MHQQIDGLSLLGRSRGKPTAKTFTAYSPTTGKAIDPVFYSARQEDLDEAVRLAAAARIAYASLPGKSRASFLTRIAGNIEALGDSLLERAALETGLTIDRFAGERARTCGQLRMFADLLIDGSWVDARIDHAIPDREPVPKPDLRSMLRPAGPVAVFCASNFPLAYSVAGGDTASALAAGCPVIVNAHIAHPGTAELVGKAVQQAAIDVDLPEGVFSLLFSADHEIGQGLVRHPEMRAVGFTGSRRGGRALIDIAAARPEPIPVFAEMSSVNPTFILPRAIDKRGDDICSSLHTSVTSGAGQFCTKPGLVFIPDTTEGKQFAEKFASLISQTPPAPLLTEGIQKSYVDAQTTRRLEGVGRNVTGQSESLLGFGVSPSVFEVDAATFLCDEDLEDEIFGPTTLFIRAASDELLKIARSLEGQLTASIHGSEEDLAENAELIAVLETKVGRLIFNGFSTGVEVCPSMVHGGPYPATSDQRTTAVGTRAIERFTKLICFQNFPDEALPAELKESNPLSITRLVDGELVTGS